MRNRVAHLVAHISGDMPSFTGHDIAHLDALWSTADELVDDSFRINPAEAFLFGGAALLHDAGMTLAAYPGGLSDLECTDEWRDSMAYTLRRWIEGHSSGVAPLDDREIRRIATIDTLRRLHPSKALQLATQKWKHPDGSDEYLIGDSELRDYYGSTIGELAKSHGEDIRKLFELETSLNAPTELPVNWYANRVTVACLLRCADAAQLDGRAPRFAHAIANISDVVSQRHWGFQDGMGRATRHHEALRFTRGKPISRPDAQVWWTCYEALVCVDRELKDCSKLLSDLHCQQLAARYVLGAESPTAMKEFIPTVDWEPLAVLVSASNVPNMVKTIGGKQLYGDDPWLPVRELIQNSADAIRARRKLEVSFGSKPGQGTILLRFIQRRGEYVLEIEDDGIGMSRAVVTGALIDFGKTFWYSDDMRHEHPGLAARGFSATGRFGIGFFSVFSIAKSVQVISRRFDRGPDTSVVLEFPEFYDLRPIFRKATVDEYVRNVSTVISVTLSVDAIARFYPRAQRLKFDAANYSFVASKLCRKIEAMCLMSDSEIIFETESSNAKVLIARDGWLTLEPSKLLGIIMEAGASRSLYVLRPAGVTYEQIVSRITNIYDRSGVVKGRAVLVPSRLGLRDALLMYCGGFATGYANESTVRNALGIVEGTDPNVSRSRSTIDESRLNLAEWASCQARLWEDADSLRGQIFLAPEVFRLKGAPANLKAGRLGNQLLTQSEIRELVKSRSTLHLYHDIAPRIFTRSEYAGGKAISLHDEDATLVSFVPADDTLFIHTKSLQSPESERQFGFDWYPESCVFDEQFSEYLGKLSDLDESWLTLIEEDDADVFNRRTIEQWPILLSIIDEIASYVGIERTFAIHVEVAAKVGQIGKCDVLGPILVFEW